MRRFCMNHLNQWSSPVSTWKNILPIMFSGSEPLVLTRLSGEPPSLYSKRIPTSPMVSSKMPWQSTTEGELIEQKISYSLSRWPKMDCATFFTHPSSQHIFWHPKWTKMQHIYLINGFICWDKKNDRDMKSWPCARCPWIWTPLWSFSTQKQVMWIVSGPPLHFL